MKLYWIYVKSQYMFPHFKLYILVCYKCSSHYEKHLWSVQFLLSSHRCMHVICWYVLQRHGRQTSFCQTLKRQKHVVISYNILLDIDRDPVVTIWMTAMNFRFHFWQMRGNAVSVAINLFSQLQKKASADQFSKEPGKCRLMRRKLRMS